MTVLVSNRNVLANDITECKDTDERIGVQSRRLLRNAVVAGGAPTPN